MNSKLGLYRKSIQNDTGESGEAGEEWGRGVGREDWGGGVGEGVGEG